MKAEQVRPDLERELSRLKDFQLDTVDYVHNRFYGDDPVRRMLVADEVGLGKTLVARGVIAKTIEELWDTVKRIDIVYICSNNQIARQNLNRLRVGHGLPIQHADRLAMLPKVIGDMQGRKINFVSFTPRTSFNLKSSGGRAGERVLLYSMLRTGIDTINFAPRRWRHFFRGSSGLDSFTHQLRWFNQNERRNIPDDMIKAYAASVRAAKTEDGRRLIDALESCADQFNYLHAGSKVPYSVSRERYHLIGQLRHLVAQASIDKLEPDLVILDEFQRFKSLMDPESEGAELARALFDYKDARLLLLSATPYKMYTLPDDPEGDDHYEDFTKTVSFLAGADRAAHIGSVMSSMRKALYSGDLVAAEMAKDVAQKELRRVIVRTERLASTPDRDGMITARELPGVVVEPNDVRAFVSAVEVGKVINHRHDLLEYWRSSPYLFEFMDEYMVKKDLQLQAKRANPRLAEAFRASAGRLSWSDIASYKQLDPGNAKMRGLVTDVLDRGAWKLAWIPPSLPYYELAGAYAEPDLRDFTKRLIFSAWTVVPKTIGAVLSYEAERRLSETGSTPTRLYDAPRATALLTFQRSEGRLTGMPVLGMMYPCLTFAQAGDPLDVARGFAGMLPLSRQDYLAEVSRRVTELLAGLPEGPSSGAADDKWYWAAPILLDKIETRGLAIEQLPWGSDSTEDDDQGGRFQEHVDVAMQVDATELGRRPDDLVEVLTQLAASGLGTVALRGLSRVLGGPAVRGDAALQGAASNIAWSLRSFFNRPEIMSVVRSTSPSGLPYWQSVLGHGADGGLQSVMDEHLHVLFETEGLFDEELRVQAGALAVALADALTLRSNNTSVHLFKAEGSRVNITAQRFRSHFAVRFGRSTAEDSTQVQRESQVRAAYNSPYWPFVLASTSVGQEGLDFHQYSHAVVHWNLPSNPVDLEQREGRVHRYKGHAVRKNVAQAHGSHPDVLRSDDPWAALFVLAAADRPEGGSEIYPYWVYPGKSSIERYAPVMPLSKETVALDRLMRTVGAYRLVIGQPRQDDLLRYLGDKAEKLQGLRIDLSPPVRP
jgi:Helicase conserved C-terminal domain